MSHNQPIHSSAGLDQTLPISSSIISVTIPPSCQFIKNDLKRFFDAMIFKLAKNAHKGRWETIGLNEAMILLKKEVDELEEAIREDNVVEIVLEAADIANFALISSSIAVDGK